MEYIDLYDEQMNPLNKTVSREDVRNQPHFFFIVHVWIRNSLGEYLIQQRNKKSDASPYMWATTMGIVQTKSDSEQAALQEVKEELGLTYQTTDLYHVARYQTRSTYANHFTDVYVIEDDVCLEDTVLQKSEVRKVKFVKKETLYDMIKEETLWDYQQLLHVDEYFIDLEKSE